MATTPKAMTLTLQICTFSSHLPCTSSYWTRIFSTHSTLWVSEWHGTDHGQDSHISQCSVKWKCNRGPVLNLSTGNRSQQSLHTCATPPTNQIWHFNTKLFIVMVKSSKSFTIATNFFATMQATNITTWGALQQEKAGTHREGIPQDKEKGSISSASHLLLQELKWSVFVWLRTDPCQKLTFYFPQINSKQASSC